MNDVTAPAGQHVPDGRHEGAPASPSGVEEHPPHPVQPPGPAQAPRGVLPEAFGRPDRPQNLQYSAPTAEGGVSTTGGTIDPLTGQVSSGGPSRNAPCPCGSGKKYKRCHGDPRHQG